MQLVKQKLFVDELFDTSKRGEIAPEEIKSYDLKAHMENETFLKDLFRAPPSILPIQNLGEMAFIV